MGATSNGTSTPAVGNNANGYISMNSQMPRMPQGWGDLVVMDPMDPRSIISSASFMDSGGTVRTASFTRSSTFLHTASWGARQ